MVLFASAVLTCVAVVDTARSGFPRPLVALAFALMIGLGELLRVNLPGDRRSSPVGVAGGLAYVLVLQVGERPVGQDILDVVTVIALASLAGTLVHLLAGRKGHLLDPARRLLALWVAAAAFRPWQSELMSRHDSGSGPILVLAALGAITAAAVVDTGISSVLRARRDGAPFMATLRNELVSAAPLGLSMAATGTGLQLYIILFNIQF